MARTACLALLALASGATAADISPSALAYDDACLAEGDACSLSAMQRLRAARAAHQAAAHSPKKWPSWGDFAGAIQNAVGAVTNAINGDTEDGNDADTDDDDSSNVADASSEVSVGDKMLNSIEGLVDSVVPLVPAQVVTVGESVASTAEELAAQAANSTSGIETAIADPFLNITDLIDAVPAEVPAEVAQVSEALFNTTQELANKVANDTEVAVGELSGEQVPTDVLHFGDGVVTTLGDLSEQVVNGSAALETLVGDASNATDVLDAVLSVDDSVLPGAEDAVAQVANVSEVASQLAPEVAELVDAVNGAVQEVSEEADNSSAYVEAVEALHYLEATAPQVPVTDPAAEAALPSALVPVELSATSQ